MCVCVCVCHGLIRVFEESGEIIAKMREHTAASGMGECVFVCMCVCVGGGVCCCCDSHISVVFAWLFMWCFAMFCMCECHALLNICNQSFRHKMMMMMTLKGKKLVLLCVYLYSALIKNGLVHPRKQIKLHNISFVECYDHCLHNKNGSSNGAMQYVWAVLKHS